MCECVCVCVCVHYGKFSVYSFWLLMKRSSQSGYYRWNELLPLTTTSCSSYIQVVFIWLFAEADLETGIWLAGTLLVVSKMMCLGYWCQQERGELEKVTVGYYLSLWRKDSWGVYVVKLCDLIVGRTRSKDRRYRVWRVKRSRSVVSDSLRPHGL